MTTNIRLGQDYELPNGERYCAALVLFPDGPCEAEPGEDDPRPCYFIRADGSIGIFRPSLPFEEIPYRDPETGEEGYVIRDCKRDKLVTNEEAIAACEVLCNTAWMVDDLQPVAEGVGDE